MNVLVIPENQTHDQFILLPIINSLMAAAGKPRAKVRVCAKPAPNGIGQVLTQEFIGRVIQQNPLVNLFLLIVDRDGIESRRESLTFLESEFNRIFAPGSRTLLAENAWQEVEVWGLSAVQPHDDWVWADIRSELNPKETYFEVWARNAGVDQGPAGGRVELGKTAGKQYKRVRALCPEVADLEARIKAWIDQRGAN